VRRDSETSSKKMFKSEMEVRSRPTLAKPKSDNNQAQQVIKALQARGRRAKAASLGGGAGKRGVKSRSRFLGEAGRSAVQWRLPVLFLQVFNNIELV